MLRKKKIGMIRRDFEEGREVGSFKEGSFKVTKIDEGSVTWARFPKLGEELLETGVVSHPARDSLDLFLPHCVGRVGDGNGGVVREGGRVELGDREVGVVVGSVERGVK